MPVVPTHALGAYAALWAQICAIFDVDEADLLDAAHAVNTTWGFKLIPLNDGRVAVRLADNSWEISTLEEAVIPDDTGPVLSAGAFSGIPPTSGNASLSTDSTGPLYIVVTQSATVPANVQIEAGLDHTGSAADVAQTHDVVVAGAKTYTVTGLVADTTYYAYAFQRDAVGNPSNVLYLGTFTTAATGTDARASFPAPLPTVGKGSATTGARGATTPTFYRVTSTVVDTTGATPGTLEYAIAQGHNYIALCVEGEYTITNMGAQSAQQLTIDYDNVTIDGRYAPGNGFRIRGHRMEPEGSNQFYDSIIHLGMLSDSGASATSEADNMRIGIYQNDGPGGDDVSNIYMRHCLFLHNGDETVSTTPRGNDDPTGNDVNGWTMDRCIAGRGIADGHKYGSMVGDGTNGATFYRNFFHSCEVRSPYFSRRYTTEVESFNNLNYNCRWKPLDLVGPENHSTGDVWRLGPISQSGFTVTDLRTPASLYIVDPLITNGTGTLISGAGTLSGTPLFTGSTVPLIAASAVESVVPYEAGPFMYGGGRLAIVEQLIAEMEAGNLPLVSPTYSNVTLPGNVGQSYPAVNGNGVPLDYLAVFPEDTVPTAVIADGSAWDGYLVAERIGRWHVWDGVGSASDAEVTSLGFFIATSQEELLVNIPSGDVAIIAVTTKSSNTDPAIATVDSTYNASNLTDLGPVFSQSTDANMQRMRLYAYTSDGTAATFATNNGGGEVKGIGGIAVSGVDAPTTLLGSTHDTNPQSATITIPGGTVTDGSLIVTVVATGADQTSPIFTSMYDSNQSGHQQILAVQNDINVGFGLYMHIGTAEGTSVGPVFADASVNDYYQGATIELEISA